jgi:two-component system sensor histidine kinase ChvG
VSLDILRDSIEITVANRGPLLPPDIEKSLFDSMVSQRVATRDNRLHFGLGLYVVRVIAERHGGSARASNLADGSGVSVTVSLPLAPAQSRLRAAG